MTESNSLCEWCGAPMAPGSKICNACGQEASSGDNEAPGGGFRRKLEYAGGITFF